MLKRYKIKYKKMQKKRVFDQSIFFFNLWLLEKNTFFKHVFAFFFTRTLFIKLKFFKKFKRKFRKKLRKKRLAVLFFCKPNFLIHEKFKNARMGKGKGAPGHWVYKPVVDKPFAITVGWHYLRANILLKYLKKYLHQHTLMQKKKL